MYVVTAHSEVAPSKSNGPSAVIVDPISVPSAFTKIAIVGFSGENRGYP